jgi:hypothetical protein
MKNEAMKLALKALEYIDLCDNDRDFLHPHECFQLDEAITAIKQALAAPVQEPVAYVVTTEVHGQMCSFIHRIDLTKLLPDGAKLYTTPPAAQRQWVGLTDEEIERSYETAGHYQTLRPQDRFAVFALARAIEAKLKEKNV